MKKYFYYLVVALVSMGFYGCSDDDDPEPEPPKNSEGYIIKDVTFTGAGTSASPLAGGLEATINGTGFSSATEIYLRPTASTRESLMTVSLTNDAVKMTVKSVTETAVTFTTPFYYGTYEMLQKEGTAIYTLGNIAFKAAKRATAVTTVYEEGENVVQKIAYDNRNRIASITQYNSPNEVFSQTTFTYDGDRLSATKSEILMFGSATEKTYEYNGNTITVTSDDGSPQQTYTLNDAGQLLTVSFEEVLEELVDVLDEDGNPIIDITPEPLQVKLLDEDGNPVLSEWGYEIYVDATDEDGNIIYVDRETPRQEWIEKVKSRTTTYTYDNTGNVLAAAPKSFIEGVEVEDFQNEPYTIVYGSHKSFIAAGSVPSWYHATQYTLGLPIYTGVLNEVTSFTKESMWGGGENIFEYDYDDDLYPTACYTLGITGERNLTMYYTISYE